MQKKHCWTWPTLVTNPTTAAAVIADFMAQGNPVPPAPLVIADGDEQGEADLDDVPGEEEEPLAGEVMADREEAQLRIFATEMLRRMREVAPRIPDERAGRWIQISDDRFVDWQSLDDVDPAKLSIPTAADTPITTAAMLRRAASVNDSVCLINWYDANRRGVRPTRLVMPYVQSGNVAAMLASVLAPMSLQTRKVDAHHWWVGSEATYDRLPVFIASQKLGDGRELFVSRIEAILAKDGGDMHRLAYDPVSDRLLMLLPRYVARQLTKVAQGIAKR